MLAADAVDLLKNGELLQLAASQLLLLKLFQFVHNLFSSFPSHVHHLSLTVRSQRVERCLCHLFGHEQRVIGFNAEVFLSHGCLCALWVYAVYLYAVAVPLLCHGLYKVDDGCLCRRVDAVEGASACVRT